MSQPTPPAPPTPWPVRAGIALAVVGLTALAYALHAAGLLGPRGQSLFGVACFLGVAAAVSSNLRAVNPRTIIAGMLLQLALALFVLSPPGRVVFGGLSWVFEQFLAFSDEGAKFVFGRLPGEHIFAFRVLPTIIFVSSFFSVLYYFGVLQLLVKVMARVMTFVMGTSGAETLSVSANVFMGQTEAPLIIRPYIAGMTRSELLALMIGGMAHISGSLMAVYIGYVKGASAEAAAGILATSVMAAPASLYVAKLILPETQVPETRGEVKTVVEQPHANAIDAAAGGAAEGLKLALNVAAMLIAFVAGVAMLDAVLRAAYPTWSLSAMFGFLFAPVAFLMGVEAKDVPAVADLLGTKLVLNEFVAYSKLKDEYLTTLSPRSLTLATYALTGFANFASIGIQLGGIGGMAPGRRRDLAELSMLALLGGFLVTLINSSLAGVLLG